MNLPLFIAEAPPPPQWWQVATGILAIPAAGIGLIYSWVLIKKTRLEAAKLTAELEKQQSAALPATEATAISQAGLPYSSALARGTIPFLLLRYVVLQLVLYLWEFVVALYSFALNALQFGAMYSLQKFFSGDSSDKLLWVALPMVVLGYLPQIGKLLIFLSIGWPLFKDANAIIGIDLKKVLQWKRRDHHRVK
ncbi:MAG: hypothetical protein JWL90_2072 [Chthoniobacteraceae bacterium]|nr:hypothetical protein [Chthoniobacteraceae bacterium]